MPKKLITYFQYDREDAAKGWPTMYVLPAKSWRAEHTPGPPNLAICVLKCCIHIVNTYDNVITYKLIYNYVYTWMHNV